MEHGFSGDFFVLRALDIARTFDSCIFAQILSEALKRGVDSSVINCPRYMYSHLKAKIKGGSDLFNIFKGVRQGGLTPPPPTALFNNSVSAAQCSVEFTCIYGGIDVSLFTYTHDILKSHLFGK